MGVIYSVACKECKVVRDLDEFYSLISDVENREDALSFAGTIKEKSFRPALLISFMAKHSGHECVLFKEGDSCEDELDPFENENGYVEDTDFWN